MVSTQPRAGVLTDDIVRFNIERKHSLCVSLNWLTMSGGAWNGICSTHLVRSHTLGTGDVLLFLLLPGAVSSKQNVFFVVIEVSKLSLVVD